MVVTEYNKRQRTGHECPKVSNIVYMYSTRFIRVIKEKVIM